MYETKEEMKDRIRKLLRSKDARTLLENFFSLTVFRVLTMFLPLITLPYLMKVIGIEKYGIIVLANSLILYFMTFTEFSFGISATRDIAIHRKNMKAVNLVYSKVFITQCYILFTAFLMYLAIIFFVPKFRGEFLVYIFAFLSLIGRTLTPDWFFQGVERMKYITIVNALTRLVFVGCIFLFIKDEADYYLHPLFLGIGSLLGGIISQYIILKHFHVRLINIKFSSVVSTLSDNFGLFVNQLLPQLYNNSTTLILGIMTSNLMVGLYGSIKQIVDFLVSLIRIISRVFFPFLARKPEYFQKFSMIFVVGSLFMILPFLGGTKFILNFFNIEGNNDSIIFITLLMGVPLLTMYQTYGTNYFLARNMDQIVVKNTIIASGVGILLAIPLIKYYGALGAAINLTFCRGLMGGGVYFVYSKNKTVNSRT